MPCWSSNSFISSFIRSCDLDRHMFRSIITWESEWYSWWNITFSTLFVAVIYPGCMYAPMTYHYILHNVSVKLTKFRTKSTFHSSANPPFTSIEFNAVLMLTLLWYHYHNIGIPPLKYIPFVNFSPSRCQCECFQLSKHVEFIHFLPLSIDNN